MFTIVIVGLCNSGKHCLLEQIAEQRIERGCGMPSIHHVSIDYIQFKVISIKGNKNYYRLWKRHYQKANAVIYVMDVSDFSKQEQNIAYLKQCMRLTPSVPTIIYANKMDKSSVYDPKEVLSEVQIHRIHKVFFTSFLDKQGHGEGIEWLAEVV